MLCYKQLNQFYLKNLFLPLVRFSSSNHHFNRYPDLPPSFASNILARLLIHALESSPQLADPVSIRVATPTIAFLSKTEGDPLSSKTIDSSSANMYRVLHQESFGSTNVLVC